jgi:hypothetical protein
MLDQFSDEQLEKELERQEKTKYPKPLPIPEPDFRSVKVLCAGYLNDLEKQGWVDDDAKYYIFEAAIEAVYGKAIWDFVRAKQK